MKAFDFSSQKFRNAATARTKPSKSFSYVPPQGARKHFETSTYITPDGKIHGEYFDKDVGKKKYYLHDIFIGNDGRPYIKKAKGTFHIEKLVIEAYHGKKPQDGKDWVIYHKDGDITNNSADNLEWMERAVAYPNISNVTQDKKVKLGNGLVVHKTGEVYQNKKLLPVDFFQGDSDLDLYVNIPPQIHYEYRNRWGGTDRASLFMESLMEEAGYIEGNKRHFTNPVVLHKDNNYKNFASDNLEWVENTDPRLAAYQKQKERDIFNEGLRVNKESNWMAYWRMCKRQIPDSTQDN